MRAALEAAEKAERDEAGAVAGIRAKLEAAKAKVLNLLELLHLKL